jgi:hypothetical protein
MVGTLDRAYDVIDSVFFTNNGLSLEGSAWAFGRWWKSDRVQAIHKIKC